ncbi:MAG TPA: hypothetical protein VHV83_14610, partial [Armatimonadota bacterium]|nr:hypothetical protein [Armatimonadota bacterium]
ISAFEFDDALWKIDTSDKTVREIGLALWYHYDDVKDHLIVASREEWDYFNRLLLLLQSDAELNTVKTSFRWTARQGCAALCLVAFCVLAAHIGINELLLVASIPFGLTSMLLAFWGNREMRKRELAELSLSPFPSVASILKIRRQVRSFSRRHYPHAIQDRQIRDPLFTRCLLIPWWIAWLLFAPIPLLFQALPERLGETQVVLPA